LTNAREIKSFLEKSNAKWQVNEKLLNMDEIPKYRTGAIKEKLILAKGIKSLDFKALFAVQPNNPFILERRVAHNIVTSTMVTKEMSIGSQPELQQGEGMKALSTSGGLPTNIDWRNRWGWPWITTIRDQNGCEACWVFGPVALVEAMVRIEHCAWPWISEGDVHKGIGATCCQCGDPHNSLDWMKNHSAADPDCFAWPVTSAGCTGCGGSGGAPYDNIPYTPTADRDGRSVRIPTYTDIGSVADQKKWLDTVGPIVCGFDVYLDFFTYGSNVYHKSSAPGNTPQGSHIMLVIGYDDAKNCWIVKNSWGTNWGDNGYCQIGYGECNIDAYAKTGLQGTNPDPWTKRRLHNGCMLESGNGALHRNFEMLAPFECAIRHWWRDNSTAGFPWNQGVTFANDAAFAFPTLTSTTFNRNFEIVYLTLSGRLHHWWFSQAGGNWNDGGVFGPVDAGGVPGFIQSNFNAPGNFEVVVRTKDNKLNHWWRDGAGWHDGGRFGTNVSFSGASLIQSHYFKKGNFELVCVLDSGQMQHWWRDNDHGMVWGSTAQFGIGIKSSPCMIEGEFSASDEKKVGNFELCVANQSGMIEHWWRANSTDSLWRKSATFGHDVKSVVALVEGSYGFNLEVIVLRIDCKIQHYWRDGNGWHEGAIIGSA
jgi:C1A family cysteine protease